MEIPAADLLPLDLFADDAPFAIDLVYAQADHPHNHFPGLYHPQARLFAHRLLIPTLLRAAQLADQRGYRLQFLDCFRPVEAQVKMAAYGYPAALVSLPGQGPHPRGLAIDVQLLDRAGNPTDMGTPFDFFTDDLARNPAARGWPALTPSQKENRALLDAYLFEAAAATGLPLEGLAEEWWDYRVPKEFYNSFAAVSDSDLPPAMQMIAAPAQHNGALQSAWQQARVKIMAQLQTDRSGF